jgi:hypothetical protein
VIQTQKRKWVSKMKENHFQNMWFLGNPTILRIWLNQNYLTIMSMWLIRCC